MMKKIYTLEDFTMESVMKEATGEWSNDVFSGEKCWNINYSDSKGWNNLQKLRK